MQPLVGQWASGGIEVSILTRAFARVQLDNVINIIIAAKVSILTRAFARVQPLSPEARLKAGYGVSILTRAFARVQHLEDRKEYV